MPVDRTKGLNVERTTTPTFAGDGALRQRVGYTAGIVINTALLVTINAWPGWEALSFVTSEAAQLVPLLNAALAAGILAYLTYIVIDRRWVKALGDLITVGLSLAVLWRTWQVFPFEFEDASVDWALILRVGLAVSIGGCVIALIVQLVVLIRELAGTRSA
jgi:hypothetical protein